MRVKTKNEHLLPRKNQTLDRTWFIKYQVANYSTGEWEWKKYKGLLNLLPTVEQRLSEANSYITLLRTGQPLPVVKGFRAIPPPDAPKNFANTVQLLYEFLAERGNEIDKGTLVDYRSNIKRLHVWLNLIGHNALPIGQFGAIMAKRFINYLSSTQKLANQTCNHTKKFLSGLWDRMISEELLEVNPWKQFKGLPKNAKHFEYHPLYIQQKMKVTLPEHNPQLYIAAMILYYDFIRPAELRRMHLYLIDWNEHTFHIPANISKSRKDDTVVIPDALYELLVKYSYDKAEQSHFIFTARGIPGPNPVGENWFNVKFKEYREAYRIPDNFKFYGLKHTGNTNFGMTGISAVILQKQNRHRDAQSIQSYIDGMSPENFHFVRTKYPEYGVPPDALSRLSVGNETNGLLKNILEEMQEVKSIVNKKQLNNVIYDERIEAKTGIGTNALA